MLCPLPRVGRGQESRRLSAAAVVLFCVVGVLPIVPNSLHVVVILKHFEHLFHVLDVVGVGESGVGRGNILNLGGDKGIALGFEVVTDCAAVVGLGPYFKHAVVGQKVGSTGLESILHELILINALLLDNDNALL